MEPVMQPTKIILGTLGYAAVTFPLAYVWHLIAFKSTYDQLGYFARDEPIVVFGFVSILMQGIILSIVYPQLCRGMIMMRGAFTLAAVMGTFHWTTHVLAEAAKHPIAPLSTWFALETGYLVIHFTLAGIILSLVYRNAENQ